ncbi:MULTISPECIES: ABC transporter permease [Rossellomorea]|jgi:ABC-2 type transport system permease protein|uniref:ABC transporter permease n=1 Tax=Rossellomorea aquimaris TaxID=189382 RepID=A0A5D4TYL5_9BACI|nr:MULTISPECIES: ABC transporter permease [Rossellomorea]MDT9023454.1 ABC transporter permease [Rossellomorea sp. YC4-1]TYS80083.1 ABC transporter permease [Rossellomorea aquimaris]TYS85468.1 ABC transporter permease [Rossellomorea aquimaris]
MNNFFLILSQSYFSKLKAKSFIISTVIIAAALVLLANFDSIISNFSDDDTSKIAVQDETGNLYDPLVQQLKIMNSEIELEPATQSMEEIEKNIESEELKGLLILSESDEGLPQALYKSNSLSDSNVSGELQVALQNVKSSLAASKLELSGDELALLSGPVAFEKEALIEGAKSEEELSQARGIVYVLLFFIYFSVIAYANMTAMEVATEKSSRVMEILISSVSPVKQMFAKIIGIGLAGLTQLAVILAVGYFTMIQKKDELVGDFFEGFGFESLSVGVIIYAVIFFLLGYFLYATLAALLGSLVSRIEDVQQMIMPMTFLIMIGFFISMFGLGNPESSFVTITSYIPFFTPMVMFLRVGMLNLPVYEPVIGIVVLLATIIILGIFGARVYRGGVLLYGKSNSFKDIKKAIDITSKK